MKKERETLVTRQDFLRELMQRFNARAISEIRRSRRVDEALFAQGYLHGLLEARRLLVEVAKEHYLSDLDMQSDHFHSELKVK